MTTTILEEADGRVVACAGDDPLRLAYGDTAAEACAHLDVTPHSGSEPAVVTRTGWGAVRASEAAFACRMRRVRTALDGGEPLPAVVLEMPYDTPLGPRCLDLLAERAGLEPPDVAVYGRFGHELREAVEWTRLVRRIPSDHPLRGLERGASPFSPYAFLLLPLLVPVRHLVIAPVSPLGGALFGAGYAAILLAYVFRNLPHRSLGAEIAAFSLLIFGVSASIAGLALP